MEMMRVWSSSLTHSRKVLASLWKIPRPSGQSRSIPATLRFGSPDTKRKWSSTSCCLTASHPGEGVVLASQVASQLGQSVGHQLLHVNSLLLGDSGGQTEPVNVATNTDTGGVHGHAGLDVSLDLLGVHVGGVLGVGGDAVILLDDGIEDLGEILVGVPVSGVDTAVLVVELHSAGDGLGEGEAAGLGLDVLDFVPSLLGDVLGHQGVGGLDGGEFSRHIYLAAVCGESPC